MSEKTTCKESLQVHPPLCPRSIISAYCGRYEFRVKGSNGSFYAHVKKHRPIVASIAEVEWRRRAARWEKLIDNIWNRFHAHKSDRFPPHDDRTFAIRKSADQCYDHARAWREWGEQK